MGDSKTVKHTSHEEVIAAFDREREQAREWGRRHTEQVRASRANDRPVHTERPGKRH